MDTPREGRDDAATGPFVRPYAFTRGRTRAQGIRLDLIGLGVAPGGSPGERVRPSREQRRILDLCRAPVALADLTSELGLPLGVVHVLLSDLLQQGLLEEQRSAPLAERPSPEILQRVLDDLRAL
jgi:hypothetical protein